jgi:ketosteroid isomerase-like protein
MALTADLPPFETVLEHGAELYRARAFQSDGCWVIEVDVDGIRLGTCRRDLAPARRVAAGCPGVDRAGEPAPTGSAASGRHLARRPRRHQGERMHLVTAERRLQAAQRDGDVEALDALLHPRVVGAGPDGTVFGKEDDLGAHRSGTLRITRLVEESIEVHDDGRTGTTRIVADVDAVQNGTEVSARLRYTRLWVRDDGSWRVLAATFAPAQF